MAGVPQVGALRRGEILTQDVVRSLFDYDPKTGFLSRRVHGHRRLVGTRPGTINRGRSYVRLGGKTYPAARIIWLHVYGYLPTLDVDHKDRDPLNDRLDNLRLATRSQNSANRGSTPKSKVGLKGVSAASKNRWYAVITQNYKKTYLGCYSTPQEAHAAYCEAAKRMNGEFAAY